MSRSNWEMPGTFTEPDQEQDNPSPTPGQEGGSGLSAFGISSMPAVRTTAVDPASTERQQRFMGAELARKRAGKKTRTGMSERQLHEYASK